MKSNHNDFWALRSAISAQAKKDSSALRGELFEVLAGKEGPVRYLYNFFSRRPRMGALASMIFGVYAAIRTPSFKEKSIAFYGSANEQNALQLFMGSFSKSSELLKTRSGCSLNLQKIFWFFSVKKAIRVYYFLLKLQEKFPLYVVMRCSECYFLFSALRSDFEKNEPKEIFVSSEGNPHGRVLLSLGRIFLFETHFVTHAPSVIEPMAFRASTGYFVGRAGLSEYSQKGAFFKKTVISNFLFPRQQRIKVIPAYRPLKICLCLSKETGTEALQNEVRKVKNLFPAAVDIAVRAHPSKLVTAFHPFARIPSNHATLEQLSRYDLVVAGSSNVHFEALTRGVPTLFSDGFDVKASRKYQFIIENLVPSYHDGHVTMESINKHYQEGEWSKKLEYYIQNEKL